MLKKESRWILLIFHNYLVSLMASDTVVKVVWMKSLQSLFSDFFACGFIKTKSCSSVFLRKVYNSSLLATIPKRYLICVFHFVIVGTVAWCTVYLLILGHLRLARLCMHRRLLVWKHLCGNILSCVLKIGIVCVATVEKEYFLKKMYFPAVYAMLWSEEYGEDMSSSYKLNSTWSILDATPKRL